MSTAPRLRERRTGLAPRLLLTRTVLCLHEQDGSGVCSPDALTHRSYAYENGGLPTNERLEFLGDSVLGLV
ncbi:hypothetical protein ACWEQ8_41080, partial [Streptomyces noursei]